MTQHNYSAEDFERYHSGQMSPAEMHALERSALEDSFLADALEGYQYTKSPVNDINELTERLSKKNKQSRLFFTTKKLWYSVAASVILIAGLVWLFNRNNSKEDLLARNNVKESRTVKDSPSRANTDTAKISELVSAPKVGENENNQPQYYRKYSPKSQRLDSPTINNGEVATSEFAKEKELKPGYEMHLSKDKKADDRSLLAPVTASNDERKTISLRDSGRVKLRANDSLMNGSIVALDYKTKQKPLTNADQNIVPAPSNKNLEEVTVTSHGIRREKKETSNVLAGKVAGLSITDSTNGPEGLQKFNQYILENINVPKNASGEKYKGKVVLSFEVNRKGEPRKIKTEQSLCTECDKEAIRLLQHGPKWQYVKGKRYFVDVNF